MHSLNSAQRNYDYSLPVENIVALLEKTTIENEADYIINNRFADLALFISENGDADIYDKHFEAMLKVKTRRLVKQMIFYMNKLKKWLKSN